MHSEQLTFPDIDSRDRASDQARFSARIAACRSLSFSPARINTLAPQASAVGSDSEGLPEIHAGDLDTASIQAALSAKGALIVRELLPTQVIAPLRTAIDAVIEACFLSGEAARLQPRSPYFDPPDILSEVMKNAELGRSRAFHRDSGSAMCAEAPCVAETLLDLYGALGLKELLQDYLGEPPCLSVKKWVLRKTRLPVHEAGWHQDGAFMGQHIKSLNVWIPLTRCGGASDAPGMDIVPRRLHNIVGAQDALFDWSVNPGQIHQQFPDTPPISPLFGAGDALLFDHLLLHRTQYRPEFERPRHAIETWFFGRSSAPSNQVPLSW